MPTQGTAKRFASGATNAERWKIFEQNRERHRYGLREGATTLALLIAGLACFQTGRLVGRWGAARQGLRSAGEDR